MGGNIFKMKYLKIKNGELFFRQGEFLKQKEKYVKKSKNLLIINDYKQFIKVLKNSNVIWKKLQIGSFDTEDFKDKTVIFQANTMMFFDELLTKEQYNYLFKSNFRYVIFSKDLKNIDISAVKKNDKIEILDFREKDSFLFNFFN